MYAKVALPALGMLKRAIATWGTAQEMQYPKELKRALLSALYNVRTSPCKSVLLSDRSEVAIVFLDGACEPVDSENKHRFEKLTHSSKSRQLKAEQEFDPKVTIGGVLILNGMVEEHFGAKVPPQMVESWKAYQGQQQFIGQAEILPTVVAKETWKEKLKGRLCIFYIDNESARYGLIKGTSPAKASQELLLENARLDSALGCRCFYGRVPTCCNIADAPSRLDDFELRVVWNSKPVVPRYQGGAFASSSL